MRRFGTRVIAPVAALLALALLASGCLPGAARPKLTPKVKPPVIGEAGTLRAAIDLSIPPYGGKMGEDPVGIDVDVASAVAERLGLKLQIVDATATVAAQMLSEGKVDIALGGLRIDEAVQQGIAFAGPYMNDAPAIFSAKEGTETLASIAGRNIAAQTGSLSFWIVADEYGDETVTGHRTLEEAFKAVDAGQAELAVGDGVVGVYMLRQHPNLRFDGQLQPAVPVGIAVAKENTELEVLVRQTLDEMASSGVLETLRRKWLGDGLRFEGSVDDTLAIAPSEDETPSDTP